MSTKRFQFLLAGTYDGDKPMDREVILGPVRNAMLIHTEPLGLMFYPVQGMAHPAYFALRDVWMEMSDDDRVGLPGRLRDSLAVLFVRSNSDPVDDPAPSTH
jgi:hypothetical protein